MSENRYQSWGRYPHATHREVHRPTSRCAPLPRADTPQLPFGNGRSYGDSCLNHQGTLLDIRGLDRFIAFDPSTGLLRCEGGVLLDEILALTVERGWFLPVTPGTRFVTVGGAIANDVHGKNHHRGGTFGCHLECFELLRSDGERLLCSPRVNPQWYRATIGGLGLTGVITWAEIRLKRINNPFITSEVVRFGNLEEFFALADASDRDYEYTVAWVDCLSRGRSLGRGLFMRGNHATPLPPGRRPRVPEGQIRFPLTPPVSLVNDLSLRAFNFAYYHRQLRREQRGLVHFRPFFYPLDGIAQWNRLYGPRGFLQWQCAVPRGTGAGAVGEILERIAASGQGSFLAVLKLFGDCPSPGMLSFPRPGVTLALDFPFRGRRTLRLLDSLDEVIHQTGGALYPAKDARMSGETFRRAYPAWEAFRAYVDPAFSSSFWRRVTE